MSLAVTDLDKVLKRLVEVGSRRKWICYEELNTCLPDEFVDPEKIDELFVLIDELGIEMVDEHEMQRNQWIKFYAPLQTNLKFQRDEPKSRQREKHVPAAIAPVPSPRRMCKSRSGSLCIRSSSRRCPGSVEQWPTRQ